MEVPTFAAGLNNQHDKVRLPFNPFGGATKTLEWIAGFDLMHGRGAARTPV